MSVFKRGRRRRVEETTDVSAYISNHNVFSYAALNLIMLDFGAGRKEMMSEDDCFVFLFNNSPNPYGGLRFPTIEDMLMDGDEYEGEPDKDELDHCFMKLMNEFGEETIMSEEEEEEVIPLRGLKTSSSHLNEKLFLYCVQSLLSSCLLVILVVYYVHSSLST
ncbi:hypothetical protein Bca52824_070746 [Brassica carinata]|uniref:Uncharacterized protein n=1 Tax=Brassica carinata TaxID=52824 RepID=A0A8X7Q6N5_BRACI|nr:hypothetical protein Bca52824_070746 [Brassica carinata]